MQQLQQLQLAEAPPPQVLDDFHRLASGPAIRRHEVIPDYRRPFPPPAEPTHLRRSAAPTPGPGRVWQHPQRLPHGVEYEQWRLENYVLSRNVRLVEPDAPAYGQQQQQQQQQPQPQPQQRQPQQQHQSLVRHADGRFYPWPEFLGRSSFYYPIVIR